MNNLTERLKIIKEKITEIIGFNILLESKLDQSIKECNELKIALNKKNSEVEMMKEENKIIKLAKNLTETPENNFDVKIKINQVIREIDKCIDILMDDK